MMKKTVACLLLTGLAVLPGRGSAQEVLFPLGTNPVLTARAASADAAFRVQGVNDTLDLPFIDDFSLPGPYPDSALWMDNGAFVNTTFCDRPVTLGVATLDGLDASGFPYDSLSGMTRICDYLTSRPLNMAFPGDTTMWLSFFYQPQGLGDEPDAGDSLVLEFLGSGGSWEYAWSADGAPDTAFREIFIHITATRYLYSGFQFRFLNYATPNGNRDHWNIDYVRLDRNRSNGDGIPDVTLLYPQVTWLRDYTAAPYPHYKALATPAAMMADSARDTLSSIDYANTSVTHTLQCLDASGAVLYSLNRSLQINTGTVEVVSQPVASGFQFPSLAGDSAVFRLRAYKSFTGAYRFENDTTRHDQVFYNYYAYDDGTAETAYGINQAGARLAYKFTSWKTDTLLGVQMYFNPSGEQVHNKLIQLCYWSSIGYGGQTEHLVYKRINLKPSNTDSLNGFVTYTFDSILVVPAGDFYVGWIQNDATLLGLGVDRNTPDTTHKFYYYQGSWYASSVRGAWMMRPLFGAALPLGTHDLADAGFSFGVSPNPTSGHVRLQLPERRDRPWTYEVYSLPGQRVAGGTLTGTELDFSDLPAGLYVLRLNDPGSNRSSRKKLMILR